MKIEQIPVDRLKPYENNAKLHPEDQVAQIAESIRQFGFNDPIGIDENDMVIEGHGRLLAAQRLGLETVPCIRLTGLTREQKRAYILVHNQLTMNTGFDFNVLDAELAKIQSIDMTAFDFEEPEISVDDYGESFVLDSSDTPQVRTLSLSLTEQQYRIWTEAIQAMIQSGGVQNPSDKTSLPCNAVAAIIAEWLGGAQA